MAKTTESWGWVMPEVTLKKIRQWAAGSFVSILLMSFWATWQASNYFSSLEKAVEANTKAIEKQNVVLDQLSKQIGDRWRKTDMEAWAEILSALNPTIKIPPIK